MEHFLIYLGIGIAYLLLGTVIFSATTKMSEIKLILDDANMAVALKLSGKVAGLAIVIGAAAEFSVNVADYAIWGAIGILAQLVSYWIVEHVLFPKVSLVKKVEEGNKAVGLSLAIFSISVALIIAGCLTYYV